MRLPAAFTIATLALAALPHGDAAERGTLRLHYVGKPIGYERFEIAAGGGGRVLTADFDFTDRGGRVQLATTLRTRDDYTPVELTSKGKTYRFVNVDSHVSFEGTTATVSDRGSDAKVAVAAPAFAVDGYAPFSAQMLLLRFWQQHGRPAVVRTVPGLPVNDVRIEARGPDSIRTATGDVRLERFVVDGVVWGRETLWLDERGSLAAAITRAGGLSFEAVREDLEPSLADFIRNGARDRIADLERLTTATPPVRSGSYALVGAMVIDGVSREPVHDAIVVVRDGRIAAVGPRSTTAVAPDVPRVDAAGKTIVAGLWDMHTHVTQIEWAPVYVASGVTTARDMGNEFDFIVPLRRAIASGRAVGPRLLLAGLVDGGGPNAFGTEYAANADEARRVVAKYHDAGFEQIKIYSLVTPDVVKALADEAHRAGMTVTGHVPNGMTIEQAVSSGYDHIAHLPIRGEAGSPDVARTIAFLKEHGTVVDPTQSWNELLGRSSSTPIASFQPGVSKIPAPLNRVFSSAAAADLDPAAARARLERGLRIVGALHAAGVPVVAGTDEGIPGHSVHREIELYVQAGFTPLEALQAATIVPSRAMKLDRELGTIEAGKRADLVVLDASPLDDISNIRRVRWTIAGGRIYDAAALWKSVRFTP